MAVVFCWVQLEENQKWKTKFCKFADFVHISETEAVDLSFFNFICLCGK